jgi:hypothetical protein
MSEIRAATVSNLAGTGPVTLTGQYAAKAWVNFNGTGTVAIRDSENVSSITDGGTGRYTINIGNDMSNANYSSGGLARRPGVNQHVALRLNAFSAPTAGALPVASAASTEVVDADYVHVLVIGDLA